MDNKTDLENVKMNRRFTWGPIIAIHEVGRYAVVEYHERALNSSRLTGRVLYHPYLDGRDLSMSFQSLEGAFIQVFGNAALGKNQMADAMAQAARKLLNCE